jgi:hypothetical protein
LKTSSRLRGRASISAALLDQGLQKERFMQCHATLPPSAFAVSLILAGMLPAPAASAAPRASTPVVQAPAALDADRRFDANDLDLWTSNFGWLAVNVGSFSPGFEFPRGSSKHVMFAAGLWVGAQVAGAKRVTVAEYTHEWAPGRIVGGTYESPYGPELRSWKVVPLDAASSPADSGFLASPTGDPVAHHAWSEYVAQGGPTGAPVDMGGPDLPGDLALWSVFNDADPGWHSSDAGSTPPLGLEVRQQVFGFRTGLPGVAFVSWTIVHRGSARLDSAYVGFWSDPDVGASTDDLVGWNGFHGLGYGYNGQDVDAVHGSTPPATGVQYLGSGTTIPLAAFAVYRNGEDPRSAVESYRLLQGLDRFGNERIDPTNSLPSRFAYSGDPVTGTGWLDPNPADPRMMISLGPLTFARDDSLTVTFALLAAGGQDRFDSIERLKCLATAARNAYNQAYAPPFPPPGTECDPPVPVALTLEEAAFSEGVVHLAWYVAGEESGPFDLARRGDEGDDWTPLGRLTADGTRRVRYEDRAVAPGEHWTYGLFDPIRPDVPLDQVEVLVPVTAGPALALRISTATGARAPQVRFTLPAAGEARLELYDVTGRRLGAQSYGLLEPGTHERDLPPTFGPTRGLVFARLVWGGRSVTAKAVLFD